MKTFCKRQAGLISLLFSLLLTTFFVFACSGGKGNGLPPAAGTADVRKVISAERAFPGAEGFGSATKGGRGGQILRVSNLDDSGPGSLRAAIETAGPRIVVFETAGIIDLHNELAITDPYITIAGQSAPPPGITLRNRRLRIGTHDVVIRHLRSRPGDAPGEFDEFDDRDALTIQDFTRPIYNVVVDHCSFSWAVDEVVGLWGYRDQRLSDITISNSIVAEGLGRSLKGVPHSKGMLIGDYATNVATLRNLLASSDDRNGPLFKGGTSGIVVNNLVYNGGKSYRLGFADDYDAGPSRVAAVANLWRDGPAGLTRAPVWFNPNVKPGTLLYLADNLTQRPDGRPAEVPEVMAEFAWDPRVDSPPLWSSDVTVLPAGIVESRVLATAGARPAERFSGRGDPIDERLVAEVKNRGGQLIDSPQQVDGYPAIAPFRRPLALPADPHGDENGNGWSNIEEFLEAMAKEVEGGR